MRLHFFLSPNSRPVPFDYQHYLTGAFHKWLGANDLHDGLSLYSLSWLYEGRARGEALEFPRGAHWFLSVHDESLAEPLVNSALRNPELCCGMHVVRIEQQATPTSARASPSKLAAPSSHARRRTGKAASATTSTPTRRPTPC